MSSINFRNYLLTVIVGIILTATGCATRPAETDQAGPVAASTQIAFVARDLLYVMSQILPPRSTTIQLGKPKTEFGMELENGFREIGYGMQRVGADQGPAYLTYSETTRLTSGNQKTHAFSVYVGDIGLEREYAFVRRNGVVPIGPLLVYGTTRAVKLNQQLFGTVRDSTPEIVRVKYVKAEPKAGSVPEITVISKDLIRDIVSQGSAELPNYTSLNSQNILIENVYTKGSSNFQMANEKYRVVRKDVIAFSDDSLRLLAYGKEQIQKIIRVYNSETDTIRLVGCSNGPTSYTGGNEGLALGRSRRVAQELLDNGVSASAILDEGCWAPVSLDDRFPARGVVIELRRKT